MPLGQIEADAGEPAESLNAGAHGVGIKSRLSELRAELADRLDSPGRLLEQYSLVDSPSTITILGDRGSGKTTLLHSICRDLIEADVDLVLPPMQPELFSPSESVISAFLAGLWAMYVVGDDGAEPREVDSGIVRMLTECARSFAASRTTEEALAHASDSTIDFAEDAVAISRSGARLPFQLRDLARRLCLDPNRGPRLMVVPVDDPDMAPLAVRAIMRDLRILGSIPGVVPIAAFCEDDLIDDWMRERGTAGDTDLLRVSQRFERQTEKLFPYRSRFQIQSLAAAGRVDFAPIGETEPLRMKLATLRRALEADDRVWPLEEIFGQVETRYGLTNPLPGNARALVQVWDTLDQIGPEDERDLDLMLRVMSNLFVLISEPLRGSLGQPAGRRFYEIEGASNPGDSSEYDLYVDLDRVQLYATPETALCGPDAPEGVGGIQVRKIAAINAVRKTSSNSGDSRISRYTSAATASLLAFNELAYGSGLFNVKNNLTRIEHSDWVNAQEVTLAGLATDDWFLTLTDAYTLSESVQVADDWNTIAGMADQGAGPRELLTAALRFSVAATGTDQGLSEESSYEEIFEAATRFYSAHRDRNDRFSKRFCAWYEFELPMQWHSAFFGAGTLRMCCGEYWRVAQKALRRDASDDWRSPRSYIDTRFGQILDVITTDADRSEHCWLAGYFELATAIESTKIEELVQLTPFWRDRTMAQHAGSRLTGKALSHSRGKRKLAPYPTPEGSELLVEARNMLRKRYSSALRNASHSGKR